MPTALTRSPMYKRAKASYTALSSWMDAQNARAPPRPAYMIQLQFTELASTCSRMLPLLAFLPSFASSQLATAVGRVSGAQKALSTRAFDSPYECTRGRLSKHRRDPSLAGQRAAATEHEHARRRVGLGLAAVVTTLPRETSAPSPAHRRPAHCRPGSPCACFAAEAWLARVFFWQQLCEAPDFEHGE